MNGGCTFFYKIEIKSQSLSQGWVNNSVNPYFDPNLSAGYLLRRPESRSFISFERFNFSGKVNSSFNIDS